MLSRWQAQRWCLGSSSPSLGWDALSCLTVLLFSSSQRTWESFYEFRFIVCWLSVVVLRSVPQISNSVWMLFRVLAKASTVCKPLSCVWAKAAEHLLRMPWLIQWAIHQWSFAFGQTSSQVCLWYCQPPLMASVTAFIISLKASAILEPRVAPRVARCHHACIRQQILHKNFKWFLFNLTEWLEPMECMFVCLYVYRVPAGSTKLNIKFLLNISIILLILYWTQSETYFITMWNKVWMIKKMVMLSGSQSSCSSYRCAVDPWICHFLRDWLS